MILSVSQSRSGERMKHKLVVFPLDETNVTAITGSLIVASSPDAVNESESDVITFRVVCLGVCYLTWNCWQKLTVLEIYAWFFIFLLYVLFLNPSAVFLHVFNSEKTRERERERQRGSESRYGTTGRRMTDINEVGGVRGVGTSRGRGSEVWLLN